MAMSALVAFLVSCAPMGERGNTSGTGASPSAGPNYSSTVRVPLEESYTTTVRAIAMVSIGDGHPARVVVDTGSAGLRVLPRAIGVNATPTAEIDVAGFPAGTVRSQVVDATFSIAGVPTGPIRVGAIQDSVCAPGKWQCEGDAVLRALLSGADGILGIAPANSDAPAAPLFSPLLQLPHPFGAAYSIRYAPGEESYLTLGSAGREDGSVVVSLKPTVPPTYPNGARSYRRDIDLCWRIKDSTRCGPTSIDTGAPRTAISRERFPDVPIVDRRDEMGGSPRTILMPGTSVEIRDLRNNVHIWSITAGAVESSDQVLVDDTVATDYLGETGLVFYYSNVVGFDAAAGEVVITKR